MVTLEGRDVAEVSAAFAQLVRLLGPRLVRSEAPTPAGA